ncbi:MAG: hypothetical protein K0S65_792 [Labilithrix sp.]|nr:hypothetical protein [Labilithrix sp.]
MTTASRITAAESARVALAAELAAARRDLWIERARRAYPEFPDAALEFLSSSDEAGILDQVRRLTAVAARAHHSDE